MLICTEFTELTESLPNTVTMSILLNANGSDEDKVIITYFNPPSFLG